MLGTWSRLDDQDASTDQSPWCSPALPSRPSSQKSAAHLPTIDNHLTWTSTHTSHTLVKLLFSHVGKKLTMQKIKQIWRGKYYTAFCPLITNEQNNNKWKACFCFGVNYYTRCHYNNSSNSKVTCHTPIGYYFIMDSRTLWILWTYLLVFGHAAHR